MPSAAFKICILGNGGVGKTTLMKRFLTGRVDLSTKMTIGLDIGVKVLQIDDFEVTLQIWDFAGEERFRFFLESYSFGASGAFFMFDLTRPSTIQNIDEWLKVFNPFPDDPSRKSPIIMLGGKSDVDYMKTYTKGECDSIARDYNFLAYFETSSVTGKNVELSFETLAKVMLENAKE